MNLLRWTCGVLLMVACRQAAPSLAGGSHHPTSVVLIDHEFALPAGATARLENSPLTVTFLRVEEDSRCPRGVTCVWAGNARVAVEISVGDGAPETLALNTLVNPQSHEVRGFMLRLMSVSERPADSTATGYRATFRLSRVTP
jgi:hypothetical protein